jgi:long-chain acyl-CoA synthetase
MQYQAAADANLVTMHRRIAGRLGRRTALRFKRHGHYHDVSWSDYQRGVDRAAAGLCGLDLRPGDRVGLLAENSVDWLVADLALLSAGAVDVPVHAPLVPNQVAYQLRHSEARGVVVSDQGQADKVLAALDELPGLEWLVAFAPVQTHGRIRVITWDALQHAGHCHGAAGLAEVRRRQDALARDDLATIIYTSGTTGNPKGVMLTHGNLLSNAEALAAVAEITPDEVLLSWLPYSHIYARTCDHYLVILTGGTICLAESVDTLVRDLAETQPTWLTAVPRFYEKVWASVESLAPAQRTAALCALFGPRIRRLSSGGAPLARHICEAFHEAGVPLFEGYGLTESTSAIAFNRPDHWRPGSVGQVILGSEVKIAADGEILSRGPCIMKGYWKDPEATRAALDGEGWLHTGDVGTLDADGFLTITDRKKDLIVTSGGKNIAPAELERLLARDPYIDQAVVYGDRKPFITALIVPNLARLAKEVDTLGLDLPAEMADDDFIDCESLHAFMQERVARIMEAVSPPERVRSFLLLARPFQIASGEMTATLKIRRQHVIDKYRDRLDALYHTAL